MFRTCGHISRRAFIASALVLGLMGGACAQQPILRVGEASQWIQIPFKLAGHDKDLDYQIDWVQFNDGPSMLAALTSGQLDFGMLGDTALLFATAAKAELVLAAVGNYPPNSFVQIVARPDSGISSAADLKGKRVTTTRGTGQYGYLLQVLDSVGLKENDIEFVDLPSGAPLSALRSGDAVAASLTGTQLVQYLADTPGAVALDVPDLYYSQTVWAAKAALADPGKRKLILDFVQRQAAAGKWAQENREAWIDAFYVKLQRQKEPTATAIFNKVGGFVSFFNPVTDKEKEHQRYLARLLVDAGQLPPDFNVEDQFDEQATADINAAIARGLDQ